MGSMIDTRIAKEIYVILTNWGEWVGEVSVFDAEGNRTVNEKNARHFFAKGLNMMIVFDDNPAKRIVTVNIGDKVEIKNEKVQNMLQTIKNTICIKYGVTYNLKKFDGVIEVKDFADDARKRLMDRTNESAVGIARTPEGASALIRHMNSGGDPLDAFGAVILEMDMECRLNEDGAEMDALMEIASPSGYRKAIKDFHSARSAPKAEHVQS